MTNLMHSSQVLNRPATIGLQPTPSSLNTSFPPCITCEVRTERPTPQERELRALASHILSVGLRLTPHRARLRVASPAGGRRVAARSGRRSRRCCPARPPELAAHASSAAPHIRARVAPADATLRGRQSQSVSSARLLLPSSILHTPLTLPSKHLIHTPSHPALGSSPVWRLNELPPCSLSAPPVSLSDILNQMKHRHSDGRGALAFTAHLMPPPTLHRHHRRNTHECHAGHRRSDARPSHSHGAA